MKKGKLYTLPLATLLISQVTLANSTRGSIGGSTTMINGSVGGLNASLAGSVASAQGIIAGSSQMAVASIEALRLAGELGREVVISAIHITQNAVEITYRASITTAELASSLAQRGITLAIHASQNAYEFTVKMSKTALESSLKAAQWSLEGVQTIVQAGVEVVVEVLYLSADGVLQTARLVSSTSKEVIYSGQIIVGYSFNVAGSSLQNIGYLMTDFGNSLYGINR